MIAIEVSLNNEVITVAGSEELGVLSAVVNAIGRLGSKSQGTRNNDTEYQLSLRVGGLTSREDGVEDEHPVWIDRDEVSVGDVVTIKLIEVSDADPAVSASPAGGNMVETSERRWFETARDAYFELKDKYE